MRCLHVQLALQPALTTFMKEARLNVPTVLQGPGTKQKQVVVDPASGASQASFQWKQVRLK